MKFQYCIQVILKILDSQTLIPEIKLSLKMQTSEKESQFVQTILNQFQNLK